MSLIVTFDGPAASGKSTVARICAERINGIVIYSGRFYRLITWILVSMGWSGELDQLDDRLYNILVTDKFSWKEMENRAVLLYQKEDLSLHLETRFLDALIGHVASTPSVRAFVNQKLHSFVSDKFYHLFDGRDMGSVVFPNANMKIFLTASSTVRAKRRFAERGGDTSHEIIAIELEKRDKQDSNRAIAPLQPGKDAWIFDNSDFTLEETVTLVLERMQTLC